MPDKYTLCIFDIEVATTKEDAYFPSPDSSWVLTIGYKIVEFSRKEGFHTTIVVLI